MTLVYKILGQDEWDRARRDGVFRGSDIDHKDGYIHLSASGQAQETARLYFHGREDLVLLCIEGDGLGGALKWEASRGGQLFPHLYGELSVGQVTEARPIALDADGVPDLKLDR